MPQSILISILKFILPGITLVQSKPSPLLLFGPRERFRTEPLSSTPWMGFDATGRPPSPARACSLSASCPRSPGANPSGTRLPPGPRGPAELRWVTAGPSGFPVPLRPARGTQGSGSGACRHYRARHGSAWLGSVPWYGQPEPAAASPCRPSRRSQARRGSVGCDRSAPCERDLPASPACS